MVGLLHGKTSLYRRDTSPHQFNNECMVMYMLSSFQVLKGSQRVDNFKSMLFWQESDNSSPPPLLLLAARGETPDPAAVQPPPTPSPPLAAATGRGLAKPGRCRRRRGRLLPVRAPALYGRGAGPGAPVSQISSWRREEMLQRDGRRPFIVRGGGRIPGRRPWLWWRRRAS
jgi:hypothetical protein